LTTKLSNPRLKRIHLHTFRHFFATLLFAKTRNIVTVQRALGHKSLVNTQLYVHLVTFERDEYEVQVADTLDAAKQLLEAGYDYITDMDGGKLFRKRK
jgi:integrase